MSSSDDASRLSRDPRPAPAVPLLAGGGDAKASAPVPATPSRRAYPAPAACDRPGPGAGFFYRSRRRRPSASSSTVSSTPTFFSSTRSRASHCSADLNDLAVTRLRHPPAPAPPPLALSCAATPAESQSPLLDGASTPPPAAPLAACCCPFLVRRRRKSPCAGHHRHRSGAVVTADGPSASSAGVGMHRELLEDWSPVDPRGPSAASLAPGPGPTPSVETARQAWHSMVDFSSPGSESQLGPVPGPGLGRHADHQDFALMDMRPPMPPLPPRQRHHSMGAAAPSRPPPPQRLAALTGPGPAPRLPPRGVGEERRMVRCLEQIYASPYYWGRMDARRAESLLKAHPSGSYLLRDSSHEEYLFTVSYRWDEVIKHIRMEQADGRFSLLGRLSFDSPIDLIEYYRNAQAAAAAAATGNGAGQTPAAGEQRPAAADDVGLLLKPLARPGVFSLANLCRGCICTRIRSYRALEQLHLPPPVLKYLRHYTYTVTASFRET